MVSLWFDRYCNISSLQRHVWESDEDDGITENTNMLRESEEGQGASGDVTVKLRRCGFCEIEVGIGAKYHR